MSKESVGVLGATSIVGECLLPLLTEADYTVEAFSRQRRQTGAIGVNWHQIERQGHSSAIPFWICLCPVWILPEYFEFLESCEIRKIVVLSSTSRFTKDRSSNAQEQERARELVESEERIVSWAEARNVGWTILRPTLIYGLGRDRNISEILCLVNRYRVFPTLGRAQGLRQPVHACDVAAACMSSLVNSQALGRSYNISGGEVLSYRSMVERVFSALGRRPRFIRIPLFLFRAVVMTLRRFPRYKHWTVAMAERMNLDMVFDHSDATRDLGFKPRGFVLGPDDMPSES